MSGEGNRQLARAFGAGHAWAVCAPTDQVLAHLSELGPARVVAPLQGMPVACVDLKAQAAEARAAGTALLVDTSLVGIGGCPAVRLGAHACVCQLGEGLSAIGLSHDAAKALPGVGEWLEALALAAPVNEPQLAGRVSASQEQWHVTSDAAQVVASYLRCHPRVAKVSYPGLKGDPSFAIAARTLQGGFGPVIDYQLRGESRWHRVTCTTAEVHAQVLAIEHALSG